MGISESFKTISRGWQRRKKANPTEIERQSDCDRLLCLSFEENSTTTTTTTATTTPVDLGKRAQS